MDSDPQTSIQSEREAQFTQSMGAFMRRDFAAIERLMASDVVMGIPGSSWLAGTHRGFEEVSRCILGLRQMLHSEETRIKFLHEADQMIVRHDIIVHGPEHEVEMALRVKVRYDQDGKAVSIFVEPEDLGLFDYVLNTMLRSQASA
jgi:ketosteroid isomerase-like protein